MKQKLNTKKVQGLQALSFAAAMVGALNLDVAWMVAGFVGVALISKLTKVSEPALAPARICSQKFVGKVERKFAK